MRISLGIHGLRKISLVFVKYPTTLRPVGYHPRNGVMAASGLAALGAAAHGHLTTPLDNPCCMPLGRKGAKKIYKI
jgi:hypothetical protein